MVGAGLRGGEVALLAGAVAGVEPRHRPPAGVVGELVAELAAAGVDVLVVRRGHRVVVAGHPADRGVADHRGQRNRGAPAAAVAEVAGAVVVERHHRGRHRLRAVRRVPAGACPRRASDPAGVDRAAARAQGADAAVVPVVVVVHPGAPATDPGRRGGEPEPRAAVPGRAAVEGPVEPHLVAGARVVDDGPAHRVAVGEVELEDPVVERCRDRDPVAGRLVGGSVVAVFVAHHDVRRRLGRFRLDRQQRRHRCQGRREHDPHRCLPGPPFPGTKIRPRRGAGQPMTRTWLANAAGCPARWASSRSGPGGRRTPRPAGPRPRSRRTGPRTGSRTRPPAPGPRR
ncbi:hypothetical protein SAMN05421854_10830 [Amycolatopsis rubida]|uniref:Uncharacterized protein n=1 Tax=Amycolatopsis rubida TaxID=112413 RepID=A0A1I5UNY0_9PSEU|nr:hypothetical protein SAMN05421854_10830 [Amycolatopsis rubida]